MTTVEASGKLQADLCFRKFTPCHRLNPHKATPRIGQSQAQFSFVSRFHPRGSNLETKENWPFQPQEEPLGQRRPPPGTQHLHSVGQELEYHIIA